MQDPTKMDYSKLFGFDMVADDVANGVDFQNATIGTKLGAKVGKASESISHQSRDGGTGPIRRATR